MNKTHKGLDRYFYPAMALLVGAVVAYGFSRTAGANLLHPATARPVILYVHAAVFSAWVILFIVQSTLISSGNVRWHRRLGAAGVALGAFMPLLGIATAIVMGRWRGPQDPTDAAFLSVSFNDMCSFGVAFGLAVYWRRRPEFHKRLMLMASCCLTVAAFARFPAALVHAPWWYAYVDALLLLGVSRDVVVLRRIHPVYLAGIPCIVAAQLLAMYLFLAAPAPWLSIVAVFGK